MFVFLSKNAKQATAVVLKHIGVFHLFHNSHSEKFVLIRNTCHDVISSFRGIVQPKPN